MNPITEIGILHISLAAWNSLFFLQLGNILVMIGYCKFGDRGCRFLSRTNFPVLQELGLGN